MNSLNAQELKRLIDKYLSTLSDGTTDEWYDTDRGLHRRALNAFLKVMFLEPEEKTMTNLVTKKVTQFDVVAADQVSVNHLGANSAKIGQLIADWITAPQLEQLTEEISLLRRRVAELEKDQEDPNGIPDD